MNKRSFFLIGAIVSVAALFISAGIYAGTKAEDVIRLDDKAYKKHKYPIVIFSHKKHQEEYEKKHPEFFKNKCGECHHEKVDDEHSKPLVDLKEGDDVKRCIECHKKADYVTGKKAKGLSDQQQREFQGNAFHDNCKNCHSKYNKKYKLKSKSEGYAPNTCKTCHSKEKK